MIMVALVLAGVLVAILGAAYQSGNGPLTAAFLTLGVLIVVLGIPQSLILVLPFVAVAAICRLAGARPRTFVVWSVLLMLSPIAILLVVRIPSWMETLELRREYPIVSLRHRLEYETRESAPGSAIVMASAMEGAASLPSQGSGAGHSHWMETFEDQLDEYRDLGHRPDQFRSRSLESLYRAHHDAVGEFMRTIGFGVGRMARFPAVRRHIELPSSPDVSQPASPHEFNTTPDAATPPSLADDATPKVDRPGQESLDGLHLASALDFLNSERFGYVADVDHVIGFMPHAFSTMPKFPQANLPSERWTISRLELVSLLKHESPSVYESDNLPNMEALAEVPTRALDQFEQESLGKLRTGEDVVVSADVNEIRMLGSLRAVRQCLECHQVGRGELLGAFTYRILRETRVAEPPAAPARPAY